MLIQLDDLLWKDQNDIQIKKLWEYLSTYCYLPRLANYSVLEDSIIRGLASDEYFALAGTYSGNRYVDIKFNKTVMPVNQSDLLVRANVALKQIAAEKEPTPIQPIQPVGGGAGTPGNGTGVTGGTETGGQGTQGGGGTVQPQKENSHFFMSAKLDTTRVKPIIEKCSAD